MKVSNTYLHMETLLHNLHTGKSFLSIIHDFIIPCEHTLVVLEPMSLIHNNIAPLDPLQYLFSQRNFKWCQDNRAHSYTAYFILFTEERVHFIAFVFTPVEQENRHLITKHLWMSMKILLCFNYIWCTWSRYHQYRLYGVKW